MPESETAAAAVTTIQLTGCSPVPLSGYLKALGILRLVSEQHDRAATGCWRQDTFELSSTLDCDTLTSFLLNDYSPTPLVAPWNGGSGFYEKDNRSGIDAIAGSNSQRFEPYRELIGICHSILKTMKLEQKPDSDVKPELLQRCRNTFPDASLQWLDAAFVLTDDGPKYPPLLGTGGNDGRLEFTNNYMQRLTEVLDVESGMPTSESSQLLADSLFAKCGETRGKASIGQFDPGSAGGANASSGYDADPSMNVWDFVLMLEGAIAFAGASVRKLEHGNAGSLAYPFCVRSAGVGYGSAALADEGSARSEMWMPLWSGPARFDAVTHLLSEGRVDVGRRRARNGVDFARAIASVGVDRGIDSFQRFGFQQRNGLSYFAVPLGRFETRTSATNAALVSEIDVWLDRFRRTATGQHAPARASAALRLLESAILEACRSDEERSALQMMVALGQAESAIAHSPKLREADYPVPPVPLLSPNWIRQIYSEASVHAAEFRLAAALASLGYIGKLSDVGPFRRHMEPIDVDRIAYRSAWSEHASDPAIVWNSCDLVQNLTRVLNRRIIDVVRLRESDSLTPFDGKCRARLSDISAFIEGHTDNQMLDRLVRGLMLVDWTKVHSQHIPWTTHGASLAPSAAYALLKLCVSPHPLPGRDGEIEVKLQPSIARRASAGDLNQATRLAARRLRGSGLNPAIDLVATGDRAKSLRIAAALVFPISVPSTKRLSKQVLRREAEPGFDPTLQDA